MLDCQKLWLFIGPLRCCHILIILAMIIPGGFVVSAAELDGVQVPDTAQVDGKTLHLNGYGLRTYSILGIHIYVASLYLEHLSTSPEEIIRSPETKLLLVRFERGVSVDQARKAWRDGFVNNCTSPCQLDPKDVEKFLADIPAMHRCWLPSHRFPSCCVEVAFNAPSRIEGNFINLFVH